MIDQDDVEKLRCLADGASLCPPPPEVLRELCRVYIAWMDAPEARPLELQCNGFDDPDRERLEKLVKSGKRVRLVEVKDAD